MRSQADAVIIGGGIIGTSVAYHLAKAGMRDITLVEMDMVGSGSSGKSAAMIQLQMTSAALIQLSRESFKEYLSFGDEFGVDCGYKATGFLNLATSDIADTLRAQRQVQQNAGVPTEVLAPQEIARLVPILNVDDIVFGSICWQDGVIDPHSVMQAYVRGARQRGAEIEEKVEATGLLMEKGCVSGVQTSAGVIFTPLVINAAGARAIQVGEWAGLKLPIKSYKRTVFVTDRFDSVPSDCPFVMDLATEWYFRKEGPGVLMGMGKEESAMFDPQLDWLYLETIVARAMHRAPLLADARVMRGWAGLRSLTPDDLPIVGPVPGVSGFFNVCGWGGHGVMHAPAAGQLVAQWIQRGHATVDTEPFRLERFQKSV
ncbi:MAG: FAD-binding oxidoreductase [Chloroflexi bacterium]|nr:FAD-binding oxidoreductase [Chloroflexota bacterium]